MSQDYETIRLETDAHGIARLMLNRPAKHNALNSTMIRDLTDAATKISGDSHVRAVVLSAHGKSFCAGGDLAWMQEQFDADRAARVAEATRLATMLRLLDEFPKLLIAVVEGPAFGGGVGLISVCDIVLAARGATFALTETKLGLIPATIAPFLIRRIGLTNARRFALNASSFGTDEAKAMGLVSEIHSPLEIAAATERHIKMVLACAPGAIADAKQLFRRVAMGVAAPTETIEALAGRWKSEEARKGIETFFLQKRPPWAQ